MFDNPVFDPKLVLNPRECPDADWAKLLEADKPREAVDAFINELRTGEPRTCIEHDIPNIYAIWFDKHIGFQGGFNCDPDLVVDRHYIGVYGITHKFEGEIDWLFDPTADWGGNKTREWSAQFNRHYHWVPLAKRYEETGDEKYSTAWEYEVNSWIDQSPRPRIVRNEIIPNPWRTIEMGIRMGWSWPQAFETFRKCDSISNDTLWRMVCYFREHGMGLLETPTGGNFKSMEANGLAHVGYMFPELELSRAFASTGLDRTIAEIDRQFLKDGSQIELAPAYAGVSISNSFSALKIAQYWEQRFGTRRGWEITPRVWDQFADTIYVLGRIAAPDGTTPNTHDSEHVKVGAIFDFAAKHLQQDRFTQKPWLTDENDFVPYAGYAILRGEGRYAMLDVGHYGAGHQHRDAMQVLTWADGDWLCIDPGKPLYNQSAMTKHIKSSAGHNVVQMDGKAHYPNPIILRTDEPNPATIDGDHVSATRRFADSIENITAEFDHTRHLITFPNLGWLIFDLLQPQDENEHWWEMLWHLNGSDLSIGDDKAILTRDDKADVHVQIASSQPLTLKNVAGQETPIIRGWWAAEYKEPRPVPTLQVCTEKRAGCVWIATLIRLAGEAEITSFQVAGDNIEVTIGADTHSFQLK